jgi:hypothetical protein
MPKLAQEPWTDRQALPTHFGSTNEFCRRSRDNLGCEFMQIPWRREQSACPRIGIENVLASFVSMVQSVNLSHGHHSRTKREISPAPSRPNLSRSRTFCSANRSPLLVHDREDLYFHCGTRSAQGDVAP